MFTIQGIKKTQNMKCLYEIKALEWNSTHTVFYATTAFLPTRFGAINQRYNCKNLKSRNSK